MSRRRNLQWEPLETRELLSRMHPAIERAPKAHPAAVERGPLTLSGTLTLDNPAAATTTNGDGGNTTSVPLKGQLAGIGAVHGQWFESTDNMGNYLGPDTVTIRGAQGAFTIAFSNASPGPAHRDGKALYYQHVEHIVSSSGAYAHSTNTGWLDLNMNPARTAVVSMTFNG